MSNDARSFDSPASSNATPLRDEPYFLSFKGKNLPRVIYRKFAKSIAVCATEEERRVLIDMLCQSIADLKLEGDWKKLKLILPDYVRRGLSEEEIKKLEDAMAKKRGRRNEKMLKVYPHCSDEFSVSAEFLDAVFGTERYTLLAPATKIFTIGSCFALNIAKYLQQRGFVVEYFGQSEDLNSPFSNAKMLTVCAAPEAQRRAYVEHWVRLLYRDNPDIDPATVIEEEVKQLKRLADSVKAAEFLVITFGNVLDYFLPPGTDSAFEIGPPVAPKFLAVTHYEDVQFRADLTHKLKEAGAEFRLGTYAEALVAIDALYTAVRSLNPHAPIVYTLSPVPIGNAVGIAHGGKLGAIEIDCISKSLLRVALGALMEKKTSDEKLFYFPSFEIVRWIAPCMDAAVLGREDASARHVSEHVLSGVYEYFIQKFGNAEVIARKPLASHAVPETKYSRRHPSKRYLELVAIYNQLHMQGGAGIDAKPENTFSGVSLAPQAVRIKGLIQHMGAQTILDYGCGKAMLHKIEGIKFEEQTYPTLQAFWGVREVTLYDPAYPPYMALPEGKFDGVVCTDVLEHCPEEDVPWILAELFGYANKFVFANVACYPAQKLLPNGENAHCTVQPPVWWQEQIMRAGDLFPEVACQFIVTEMLEKEKGHFVSKEHYFQYGIKA